VKDSVSVGSLLVCPVQAKDRLQGALVLLWTSSEHSLTVDERKLVGAIASQAAMALENARLLEEARRAYDELARTQDQLIHAQKMEAVGRLAGGVAHDFNNLLTVIAGRAALLEDHIGPESALARHVHLIDKTVTRAERLTKQLLAFSRKQVLQPKLVAPNTLVANMAGMLRRLIGEDVEFITSLAPGVGAVLADPGQLEQVIMNLAVNARDAMPGGGRLTLGTSTAVVDENAASDDIPPGSYVVLTMTDTGVGMDEEVRVRLFEPFFTTKGPGKGTGLGLSMVYGIVKQSGGHILVDSVPGHGARFAIYLPRAGDATEIVEAESAPAAPHGSETILLVEDELEVRELVQEVLQGQGYTVIAARDGHEALRLADRHRDAIALAITDVVMPQMNGRELAERLGRLCPSTKILYMSGYADAPIVQHGVLEPGVAFLQKPFAPAAVAWKVHEVLHAGDAVAVHA
jgi:two-component system, cell cycle sensor histidine kinase and response regulator CckA